MSFKTYKNSRFLFENDYFGGQGWIRTTEVR